MGFADTVVGQPHVGSQDTVRQARSRLLAESRESC